jgi:16S rRNA processing protein RimM
MMPKLHTIGRVAGKHGYNGEISLFLNRQIATDSIKKGNFLFIEFDGKGVPFLIEQFRKTAGIVKLVDISSADAADELEGRSILLETTGDEKEAEAGSDLHGFSLFTAEGKLAGNIAAIEEYPAGPMLVIEQEDKTYLVPFVEDWVVEINTKIKRVVMDFPEGLTDL